MTLLLVLACKPTVPGTSDSPGLDSEDPVDSHDSVDSEGTDVCETAPALPLEYETLKGFTRAEDFAFNTEGQLVAVDMNGNLTAYDIEGGKTVLVPGVGAEVAGTRFLPDGDLIVANVGRGSLVRITPEGAQTTILSGISYPNGVEVDPDGMVYVAEHDRGRVRRVDPDTGAYTILATDLVNPNGLRFSPDWNTLFVGSFGGGTVHALTRDGDEDWPTELFGTVGEVIEIPDPCLDKVSGDVCTMIGGGYGLCADGDEGLECGWTSETASCAEAVEGDACTSADVEGSSVESVCADNGEELICPTSEGGRIEPCIGKGTWDSCRYEDKRGYCVPSYEDVAFCLLETEYYTTVKGDCADKSDGEVCSSDYPSGPYAGTCIDYGGGEKYCQPYGQNWGDSGGLDGINVDECGNVYVTEYIAGKIWMFPPEGSPDGAAVELAVELPSQWIPNLRWGLGVGGFEENMMYVTDRDSGKLFVLDMGLGGGDAAYMP
jgi:sugar lactone lactonase YvrE